MGCEGYNRPSVFHLASHRNRMEGFVYEDLSGGLASVMYRRCILTRDLGPFREGDRFKSINVERGSGTAQFITYEGKWHTIWQLFPREQPYYTHYLASCWWHVEGMKRRRLNAPGDDMVLAGDNVYSEKQVVTRVQRKVKDRLWQPGGAMYMKLSKRKKGEIGKRD